VLANIIEWLCIALVGAVAFLVSGRLPESLGLGYLLNFSAALFLGQGIVRDLTIYYRAKKRAEPMDNAKGEAAICLESSLGILVIAVGAVMMIGALGPDVQIAKRVWPLMVVGIMLFGWACKDIVIKLQPLRLAIEKDHANIKFSWKS